MEQDKISRIICDELNLRAYTATCLNTVRQITAIHDTTPNATYALGRTIISAVLLSATLKPGSDQSLLVKFSGSGPIKEIHVQVDAKGHVRGYAANPKVDLTDDIGKISFSKTIGAGFLTITRGIDLKDPYKSVIPLQSGEAASDIAYFLTKSDQIPSALILGMNLDKSGMVSSAGGILIQTFPDTKDDIIAEVEDKINSMENPLGNSLEKNINIHSIVSEIFNNKPISILSSQYIKSACGCRKEAFRSVIKSLPEKDLLDMINEDKGAEIKCTFCSKSYNFNVKELSDLIN